MVKFIVMFARRPDFPAESFARRWLEDHGALVRKHAATLRIRRYVQSHRLASEEIDAFTTQRGWPPCEFDGVTEVWLDSLEDFSAALATPEGQAASMELAQDEKEFVDMSRVQTFMSEEHVVC